MVCLVPPDLNQQQHYLQQATDVGTIMTEQNGSIEAILDDNLSAIPSAYPIIIREDLDIGRQLGAGAYGSVYSALWKSRKITVAVKKVFMLEKEAYILSRVRHRNIIQFYGVCPTNPDFFIVTEFAEHGSLYDYLHNEEHPNLHFSAILTWATEIAQGVHYLHYEAPDVIIHRDLKSKNIVLSKYNMCKLCDFGTSKNLTHSQTAPTWGGTAAWMSPEVVSQSHGISTAADVWSYSVVLWEMLSREVPYNGLSEFRIYTLIAEDKVKLVIPDSCPRPLAALMGDCWNVEPKERIDFKKIIIELHLMREDTKLNRECEIFLRRKDSWKRAIDEQITQLKTRECELARKSAELDRREKELEIREHTQRTLPIAPPLQRSFSGDATLWDEEQVCAWIVHLRLGLSPEVQKLFFAAIHRHSINGARILDLSRKDLEFLGLTSLGHLKTLTQGIQLLRQENHRLRNFPSLAATQKLLQRIEFEKTAQPLTFKIVLHVTMYQRHVNFSFESSYRFKVLVDSDWQDNYLIDDLPPDLRDSHSVIQNVCITTLSHDNEPLGDISKRCQAPFGLTHWLDAPTDGSPVTASCVVSYTDRVIKPRNTRITVNIVDFTHPSTLLEKTVELNVRPFARKQSSAAAFSPEKTAGAPAESSPLRGVWRERSSIASVCSNGVAEEEPFHRTNHSPVGTSTKSPLWAEIAAGIRESPSVGYLLTPRQTSEPTVANATSDGQILPVRAISDEVALRSSRTRRGTGRFGTASGRVQRQRPPVAQAKRRGDAQIVASNQLSSFDHRSYSNEERSEGGRASFFLDEAAEESIPSPPGILTASKAYPHGFFGGGASLQAKPSETLQPSTKAASSAVQDDSKAIKTTQCSRKVHGGYGKWAWKG
uniref:Mitogen-activated protein kinase kinase kinase n=2 Tax=Plectus sambesii TaxID=2011161 RepID=A0A914X470_9BILA